MSLLLVLLIFLKLSELRVGGGILTKVSKGLMLMEQMHTL